MHVELHAKMHAKPKKTEEEKITDNPKRVTYDSERVINKLSTLSDQIKELNQINALFAEVCEYLANLKDHDRFSVYFWGSKVNNSLLYKDNKLWVTNNLRLDIIQKIHDQPTIRHAKTRKTILLIQ